MKATILALLPIMVTFSLVSSAQGLGNSSQAVSSVELGYRDGAMFAKNSTACLDVAGTQSESQYCVGYLTALNASNTCSDAFIQKFGMTNYCLGYKAGFNATINSGAK